MEVPNESKALPPKSRRKPEKKTNETFSQIASWTLNEINPKYLKKWPRYGFEGLKEVGYVLGSVRHIVMVDVVSGIVNSCLLFTFCAVFSTAIFGDIGLTKYVAMGTGCNLVSVLLMQGAFAFWGDCKVVIAGPDVAPTIFLALMSATIRDTMVNSLPQGDTSHRRLASGGGGALPPNLNMDALLATVLAMIMITSCVFGTLQYLLGRFRLSRAIPFIPGSLLAGFMACIGYLVGLKAIQSCMPYSVWNGGASNPMFWAYMLPAFPIGLGMYLQKRWSIGTPVVVLPLILAIPLILFYIIVYGSGSSLEQARAEGWMYPEYGSEVFYSQFVYAYGLGYLVDWNAISACMSTMFVAWIICTLDSVLKQAAIRKILKASELRIDHELTLMGKANLLGGLCVGTISYPAAKFVAINYGIIGNKTSRIPGMITALLNGIIWFAALPVVNFLPRFWLSGVLIFAATGFLWENLVDGYWRFTFKEFASVWAIVIINAIFGLLWAVVLGVVLAALSFSIAYARQGPIKSIFPNSHYQSGLLRTVEEELKLEQIGTKSIITRLHRFIFFGTATYISDVVLGVVKEQETFPEEKRAKYFLFDFGNVDNVDVSAQDVFVELISRLVTKYKFTILFSGLSPKLRRKFNSNLIPLLHEADFQALSKKSLSGTDDLLLGIVGTHRRVFDTLDRGLEFLEDFELQLAWEIRQRWFQLSSLNQFHIRSLYRNAPLSFLHLCEEGLGSEFDTYLVQTKVPKGWSLCREGDTDRRLFYLVEGSLSMEIDGGSHAWELDGSRIQTFRAGAFVNEDALYEQASNFTVRYTVKAEVDSTILALSQECMQWMEQRHPKVAIEIHRRVLVHSNRVRQRIVSFFSAMDLWQRDIAVSSFPIPDEEEEAARLVPPQDATKASFAGLSQIGGPSMTTMTNEEASSDEGQKSDQDLLGLLEQGGEGVEDGKIIAQQLASKPKVRKFELKRLKSVFKRRAAAAKKQPLAAATGSMTSFRYPQQNQRVRDFLVLKMGEDEEVVAAMYALAMSSIPPPVVPEIAEKRMSLLEQELVPQITVGDIEAQQQQQEYSLSPTLSAVNSPLNSISSPRTLSISATAVSPRPGLVKFQRSNSIPVPAYRLNAFQLRDARRCFEKFMDKHTQQIPVLKLEQALAKMGVLYQMTGAEEAVSLEDFVSMLASLMMPALDMDVVSGLSAFFAFSRDESDPLLTEASLHLALPALSTKSVADFVHLWGQGGGEHGGVTFSGLCSAVALHVNDLRLNQQVESDWNAMSKDNDFRARPEDIAKALGFTAAQAHEMVWEAACEGNDDICLFELLDTLMLGYDSRIEDGSGIVIVEDS